MPPFIVQSDDDASGLLNELIVQSVFERAVVGLDFETTGCNPNIETPVGKARVWCMTVAWGQPSEVTPSPFKTAFVPRQYLEHFRPWLECPAYEKIGANLHGFDRHALKNEGIELRGIAGCISAMSRLLDPSKKFGHGNKAQGEALGYRTREYKDISTVPVPGPVKLDRSWMCITCERLYEKARKRCAPEFKCGGNVGPTRPIEVSQRVDWVQKELPELWADYPGKRAEIVQYACLDPAMSLDAFHRLKRKLAEVRW